ncbi:DUF2184 domain-containing protein [Acinetobacter sp. V91_7]|uniref:major capsid family protein n=1 Tax=unclassified Acinetobacter TaxID=196816 RepID=UPI00287CEC6D|nr:MULTISPECIES: major capsid family protein [unclassified Acinetobacter]MDS7935661.1 DUF2184 domain-containing protein [Acinetobacter sp. V91_4B]MDS7964731.1 DUF2184 domain-containing protein [Acinetobacter sp. V91_7]MDS8025574.1 DUF2184 domain-containing protein [Acinetobacter sp. V91_13]
MTTANSGVLSMFTTHLDPRVIDTIVKPMKMAEAFKEVKKGDWTSQEVRFMAVESTGETSTYGDHSNNGMSGANASFPLRETYHYQTIINVGEQEAAIAGTAGLDLASRKQIAASLALNKFQNKSYIFGVKGKKLYGTLNDPDLEPAITSQKWEEIEDADVLYGTIQKLFKQLVKQSGGIIDRETAMTMLLSSEAESYFTITNGFGVNVTDLLKKNFPNLTIVTVPEYETTAAGQMVQLYVDEHEGQPVVELGFTEKMRAHALIPQLSSYKQKRSQGTCGAVIYFPFLVATMIVS